MRGGFFITVSHGSSGRSNQRLFTCHAEVGRCCLSMQIWEGSAEYAALQRLLELKGAPLENYVWSLVFEHRGMEFLTGVFEAGVEQGKALKSAAIARELGLR